MSHCRGCVVRASDSLTLLEGMGLSDSTTPPESLETEGQVGRMSCALVTTQPPPPPARDDGLCAICGLRSWLSFAFSFNTELSPWEPARRAAAGGRAQGTFPIVQGQLRAPLFQEICLLQSTRLSSVALTVCTSGAHMAPGPLIVSCARCPSRGVCAAPRPASQSPGSPPTPLPPLPRPSLQHGQHLQPQHSGSTALAPRVLLCVVPACV